jgi:hypothetical protein
VSSHETSYWLRHRNIDAYDVISQRLRRVGID